MEQPHIQPQPDHDVATPLDTSHLEAIVWLQRWPQIDQFICAIYPEPNPGFRTVLVETIEVFLVLMNVPRGEAFSFSAPVWLKGYPPDLDIHLLLEVLDWFDGLHDIRTVLEDLPAPMNDYQMFVARFYLLCDSIAILIDLAVEHTWARTGRRKVALAA